MEDSRKAMIMASAAMAINSLAGPAVAETGQLDTLSAEKMGKKVKKAPKKKKKKRVVKGKKRRPKAPDDGFSMPAGTLYDVIARSDLE